MRLLKLLIVLILIGVAALVAYAYLGDMDAPQNETRVPISIDGEGE